MAIFYQPKQKISTGKWFMTSESDESDNTLIEIGYCLMCDGHDTEAQATAHWDEYRLDKQTVYSETDGESRCQCLECGEWTNNRVLIRGPFCKSLALCKEHAVKEVAKRHMRIR